MKTFWFFFLVLLVMHQDLWNWGSGEIAWAGMPIGLFYHVLFSLACAGLGTWAVLHAWPKDLEECAEKIRDENQSPKPRS